MPRRQMVVIPELWARKYGAQLADMGVSYAIYVQNGYYITKGRPADLDRAYQSAQVHLDHFRRRQPVRGAGVSWGRVARFCGCALFAVDAKRF
jgi:hypothetical protein